MDEVDRQFKGMLSHATDMKHRDKECLRFEYLTAVSVRGWTVTLECNDIQREIHLIKDGVNIKINDSSVDALAGGLSDLFDFLVDVSRIEIASIKALNASFT